MFKPARHAARFLPLLALLVVVAPQAGAQVSVLRNSDDQFIQELREQDMSDLLERFVETDPPEDPIAKLALDVALKEFVASDLLKRASEANQQGNTAQAVELFNRSKQTFEEVLDAQRQLVADHQDDERLPIWQSDLAEMLIDRYLPRYHQRVSWHYEYGLPSDEHARAFEESVTEALVVTSQAMRTLDLLRNRVGNEPELRARLEEQGIWYRLDDYRRINTSYWYAHAAHAVSLLPLNHPYYTATKRVETRRPDPKDERTRLRNSVVDAVTGALESDERTEVTAKLLAGRTLVWSDNVDDNDDGVELYLEPVIEEANGEAKGFLAKLSKAIGRWKAGELDTAMELLEGMENDDYVSQDNSGVSRLLSADLMFRILNVEADKLEADERQAAVAEAYQTAYVPLIGAEDPKYRNILFERWAADVQEDDDPTALPATVRMGIGEQLTQQGGALAQTVTQTAADGEPQVPGEAQQWRSDLNAKLAEAKSTLDKAVRFNQTLTGDDVDGPVLARGLYNLGMNRYWLAELAKVSQGANDVGWKPYFEVAKLWLQLAQREPDAAKAREALAFAVGLLQGMDSQFNSDQVQVAEVREVYKEAFDLINELWPQSDVAQNNRVYAGFHLYEKQGDIRQAVEVYRPLPSDHKDYYQARRQMIYAMHRRYRQDASELLLHEAVQPAEPAAGASGEQVEAYEQATREWEAKRDALVETLGRQSGDLIEEAELLAIDASEEAENAQDDDRRFSAATAHGAAIVVLAGMEADQGDIKESLELLEGFEETYSPKDGEYVRLAEQQRQPDSAKSTLRGLIRSAQQQRILSLLDAGDVPQMANQAAAMMNDAPDVAAAVVGGVLKRVRAKIEVQERIARDAPFRVQKEKAQEQVQYLAGAAVELTKLLVDWAQDQGFNKQKMVAYRMPLADALMLAGQAQDALDIMKPIEKEIPNNFDVAMKTGMAYLEVYKQTKQPEHYNGAMGQFTKIINYYNQRPDKPAAFWDAWLQTFRLLDAAGGDAAKVIPKRGRMLHGIDEDFGGAAFKDRFLDIIDRNGGIEQLRPGN